MKKLLLILLTVMMGISSLTLSAQNTLTVAEGTATNAYVPVYGLYVDEYLRCQTIYPAGMFDAAASTYGMMGADITGVTYYLGEAFYVSFHAGYTYVAFDFSSVNASDSFFMDNLGNGIKMSETIPSLVTGLVTIGFKW